VNGVGSAVRNYRIYRAWPTPALVDRFGGLDMARWKIPVVGRWGSVETGLKFPLMNVQYNMETHLVYGPVFCGNYRINSNCGYALSQAASKRLLSIREPETRGSSGFMRHYELVVNQYRFMGRQVKNLGARNGEIFPVSFTPFIAGGYPSHIRKWVKFFTSHITPETDKFAALEKWVNEPRKVKKLRVRIFAKHFDIRNKAYHMLKGRGYADYKLKPGEKLAHGKQLRCIGELGEKSAFAMGPFMDKFKSIFEHKFHLFGGYCQFIPGPFKDMMSDMVSEMVNAKKVRMFFFSDDSVVSIQCIDGTYMANMDIRACDGSNFAPVFQLLRHAMMHDVTLLAEIEETFLQLTRPCRLVDLTDTHFKKRYVEVSLAPGQYTLYSGSTLTTAINDLANTLIFISVAKSVNRRGIRMAQVAALIEAAAAQCGFVVKLQEARAPEHIQFLKHSFTRFQDRYEPWVNIGVWLRFGASDSPILGVKKHKFPLKERCVSMNLEVIQSRSNWGLHCISESFSYWAERHKSDLHKTVAGKWSLDLDRSYGSVVNRIPDEAICERYSCSLTSLHELCDLIRNCALGDHIVHPLIHKIFNIDYGYEAGTDDLLERVPNLKSHPHVRFQRTNTLVHCTEQDHRVELRNMSKRFPEPAYPFIKGKKMVYMDEFVKTISRIPWRNRSQWQKQVSAAFDEMWSVSSGQAALSL